MIQNFHNRRIFQGSLGLTLVHGQNEVVQKIRTGKFFRKILFSLPSWTPRHTFIHPFSKSQIFFLSRPSHVHP